MATNVVIADGIMPAVAGVENILYTATGSLVGTRITAFTAYNAGAVASYQVFIYPSAGSAIAQYEIVPTKPLAANGVDAVAEIINQLIPANGKISVMSSVGNTIAFRASGIEF